MLKKIISVVKEHPLVAAALGSTLVTSTGIGMLEGWAAFLISMGMGMIIITLFKAMDHISRDSSV